MLANWAITSASDTILEPSFGGCGFLKSAISRLSVLGTPSPQNNIYGCDVDKNAFRDLAANIGRPVDIKRFVLGDFLEVSSPANWPKSFSTILANPPYIPYQKLSKRLRASLLHRATRVAISGRASLWAYFVGHALNYLRPGGRMAWVLPAACLQTYYAAPIREYLSTNFRRSAAIVLRQRMFLDEGTDEETVIIVADGHGAQSQWGALQVFGANNIVELEQLLLNWDDLPARTSTHGTSASGQHVNIEASLAYNALLSSTFTKSLGSFAAVKIGLVTGANHYFVLSRSELREAGLKARDCKRVLAKFKATNGLNFALDDHNIYTADGGRGYLVDGAKLPNPRLQRYFRRFKKAERVGVKTFLKRSRWNFPDDHNIPDAFFPVMHHTGPRVVINDSKLNCTNTIYRVYFRPDVDEKAKKLLAISLLTSFSQMSAELVGRRYGSGVLKHEPREAEKIHVLMPSLSAAEINKTYRNVDSLLRRNKIWKAYEAADNLILSKMLGNEFGNIRTIFLETLKTIREHRNPDRR